MNKYAYCTLLSTEDYLLGVLICHWSWKQTNSKYPFLCIVTDNICESSKNILKSQGIEVIEKKKYIPLNYLKQLASMTNEQASWSNANTNLEVSGWHNCWSKFLIFQLTDYDKLIYADSDMWFLRNTDELFEKPHITAVEDYGGFNAGFMVLKPSLEEYKKVTEYAEEHYMIRENVLANDQWILNNLYPDWNKHTENILPDYYSKSIAFINDKNEDWLSYNIGKVYTFHIVDAKPWLNHRQVMQDYNNQLNRPNTWLITQLYYNVINTVIKELKNQGIQRFWEYF